MAMTLCHPRLRFSLRSLLALTTIVAVFFGWFVWNVRVVRERKALLSLPSNRIAYWKLAESESSSDYRGRTDEVAQAAIATGNISDEASAFPATELSRLTWLRRRLGDRPYLPIRTSDPLLVPRIRKWFPEAVCFFEPAGSPAG